MEKKIITNPNIDLLADYPFKRLSNLLDVDCPPKQAKKIILSIGEPHHSPPKFLKKIINENYSGWASYPPTLGSLKLNLTCINWLKRRYSLTESFLDAAKNILQVAGTREGLFNIALAINTQNTGKKKPVTLMPDPFYQVYAGAALMSGSEAIAVPSLKENKFVPSFSEIDNDILKRTTLIYVCSPSNPEGAFLSYNNWKNLIILARKINAVIVADECYSEIYINKPPVGIIEACYKMGGKLDNIIAFHSLSKRSNVPGIRSGFAVGDQKIIKKYKKLRQYCAGQQPIPVQEAAIALWNDDKHVEENRLQYKEKFKIAKKFLGDKKNFYMPDGGFYLWLDVGNGEEFTKKLWKQAGIKVMPGSYLSQASFAKSYIRIALVANYKDTHYALKIIAQLLKKEF